MIPNVCQLDNQHQSSHQNLPTSLYPSFASQHWSQSATLVPDLPAPSEWLWTLPRGFSVGRSAAHPCSAVYIPLTLAMAGKLGGQWFVWQFSTGAQFPFVRAVITSMHVVYSWSDVNMLAHMHFGRHTDRLF